MSPAERFTAALAMWLNAELERRRLNSEGCFGPELNEDVRQARTMLEDAFCDAVEARVQEELNFRSRSLD